MELPVAPNGFLDFSEIREKKENEKARRLSSVSPSTVTNRGASPLRLVPV